MCTRDMFLLPLKSAGFLVHSLGEFANSFRRSELLDQFQQASAVHLRPSPLSGEHVAGSVTYSQQHTSLGSRACRPGPVTQKTIRPVVTSLQKSKPLQCQARSDQEGSKFRFAEKDRANTFRNSFPGCRFCGGSTLFRKSKGRLAFRKHKQLPMMANVS